MVEAGGFKNKIFAFIIFGLFAWLILSVAVGFGAEYGRTSQEIGNGSLSTIAYEENIENINSTAESQRVSFESGDLPDVDTATGIFSTLTNMVEYITTSYKLIGEVLESLIGIPSEAINVIMGILSLSIIFGIWRTIRIGD